MSHVGASARFLNTLRNDLRTERTERAVKVRLRSVSATNQNLRSAVLDSMCKVSAWTLRHPIEPSSSLATARTDDNLFLDYRPWLAKVQNRIESRDGYGARPKILTLRRRASVPGSTIEETKHVAVGARLLNMFRNDFRSERTERAANVRLRLALASNHRREARLRASLQSALVTALTDDNLFRVYRARLEKVHHRIES